MIMYEISIRLNARRKSVDNDFFNNFQPNIYVSVIWIWFEWEYVICLQCCIFDFRKQHWVSKEALAINAFSIS